MIFTTHRTNNKSKAKVNNEIKKSPNQGLSFLALVQPGKFAGQSPLHSVFVKFTPSLSL